MSPRVEAVLARVEDIADEVGLVAAAEASLDPKLTTAVLVLAAARAAAWAEVPVEEVVAILRAQHAAAARHLDQAPRATGVNPGMLQ